MLFKRKKRPQHNRDVTTSFGDLPTGGPQFGVSVQVTDNLVIGVIYEIQHGVKTEVARGHGHIIHAGALGIVQATSYAFREAWRALAFKEEAER